MTTGFDAENRFKALASKGNKQRGKALIRKLQEHYGDADGRSHSPPNM